jgi:hypothetical protein
MRLAKVMNRAHVSRPNRDGREESMAPSGFCRGADKAVGRRRYRYIMNIMRFLCFALIACFSPAQEPPRDPGARSREGRPGPWDQDVAVHRVGRDGNAERTATFERAGVPTLARLADGRLLAAHQHFPADFGSGFDKVAVRFSEDEGRTWSAPQVIQLTGLPEGMRFPFDPTLVPLPDGRVRLYFTSTKGRRLDASTAIYSAISRDGIAYEFEPGVRFGIEGRLVIDCAVVLHRGVFHLYSPDNGAVGDEGSRSREGFGYHATSSDGLAFQRADDVEIPGQRRWLGNAQSDGQLITFFGTGMGVWLATSEDGAAWKLAPSLQVRGADPGAVAARDGGYIVVATTAPRPGTPSEQRRPRPRQP